MDHYIIISTIDRLRHNLRYIPLAVTIMFHTKLTEIHHVHKSVLIDKSSYQMKHHEALSAI